MTRRLDRRSFLRGAGVALALPWLDAMRPALGSTVTDRPRRLVAIQTNQGILPQFFFPQTGGVDYQLTPYLRLLENHRRDFTVFSGLSHPDVNNGHAAEACFLSAAPNPGTPVFRNSVSVDQVAAERLGATTRFPSLVLAVGSGIAQSMTRMGLAIQPESNLARIYQRLFVNPRPEEVEQRIAELRQGRSMLDAVRDSSRELQRDLGTRDRERIDQYFTAVRDVEQRMQQMETWERRPRPSVAMPAPQDVPVNDSSQLVNKSRLMYDLIRLALETDSTRVVSLFINATVIHNLTHHGNRPEVIRELRQIEESQFRMLDHFLTGLRGAREEGETLLERTSVVYGTCMGNAGSHTNFNLPVLLAGGGFRHGRHLTFDARPGRNYPMANLYVSILQRLGLEVDRFASSTGTMRGLEVAG